MENEAVLDRMAARLKARPEILDRRRKIPQAKPDTIHRSVSRMRLRWHYAHDLRNGKARSSQACPPMRVFPRPP
jgi:hypothetical protein